MSQLKTNVQCIPRVLLLHNVNLTKYQSNSLVHVDNYSTLWLQCPGKLIQLGNAKENSFVSVSMKDKIS